MSRDVKLKAAYSWRGGALGPYKTPEICKIAGNFRENLDRIRWNALLLPWMVGKATLYQEAATCVEMSVSADEAAHPDFQKNAQAKIHAITDADEERCLADINLAFKRDEEALHTIKFLLGYYAQPKPDGAKSDLLTGFDALYQSMIIGAWTAFEVMAGDLWEAALNEHPVDLASLPDSDKNMKKTIELRYLEANQYDLSRKMGSIHRDSGRFKFQVLGSKGKGGIRDAYLAAFQKDGEAVESAISDLSLDALSLLRNALVHCAGKPDEKFLKAAKHIPSLSKWLSGDPIQLDGEDVSNLINAACSSSVALIRAVDDWLVMHE